MNATDLTRDELILLNTNFGEELEKQARAIAADENVKLAEVEGEAENLFNYGAELAMQKIAEMEMKYKEGDKKYDKDSEEYKKMEKEKGEKSDSEKTASAMGKFILEGYWDTMMEKGAEYYGDKNVYLEELVKEAKYGKVMSYLKGMGSKAKDVAGKASVKGKEMYGKHMAPRYQAAGEAGRKAMGKGLSAKERARYLGMAAKKTAPELAVGAAGAGAYGLSRKKK